MEHTRYMAVADINERNKTLDAMQHNLALSGENDAHIRLNKLKLKPDFKLQKPYSDSLWTVVRELGNGQFLVKHEATHPNDQDHVEIWGRHKLCRVPKGII